MTVVLSSQASAEFRGDAFMLYRRMRSINPSPYMFFMRLPEVTLFGSSPELMVRCTDGKLQLSPIAGTRRRGRDDEEDAALAADLSTGLARLQDAFAEVQVIFDDAQNAFDGMQLPETGAEETEEEA